MKRSELKDMYRIGFGYPQYYRMGMEEGVYFYSDTDKRLSNTRDTIWPAELNQVDRAKRPQYELILRKIKPKKRHKKQSKKRKKSSLRRFLESYGL